MEKWKLAEEVPFGYHISNLGRVKSFRKGAPVIVAGMSDKYGIRHLSVNKMQGNVNVYSNKFSIPRMVAIAFNGREEGKEFVFHIDGDTSNDHHKNLQWSDRKREENHFHKLKDEDIQSIVKRHYCINNNKSNTRALAKEYNVHVCTINRAVKKYKVR